MLKKEFPEERGQFSGVGGVFFVFSSLALFHNNAQTGDTQPFAEFLFRHIHSSSVNHGVSPYGICFSWCRRYYY